jgi:hypothetical protein
MITNFTRIIFLDYRGLDNCYIFRGKNNGDNRGIPVINHFILCTTYFSCSTLS